MAKILLVDDESRYRSDLAQRLNLRGYETTEAGNGEDAIKIANGQRICFFIGLSLCWTCLPVNDKKRGARILTRARVRVYVRRRVRCLFVLARWTEAA